VVRRRQRRGIIALKNEGTKEIISGYILAGPSCFIFVGCYV
jgi:hypothetical protein